MTVFETVVGSALELSELIKECGLKYCFCYSTYTRFINLGTSCFNVILSHATYTYLKKNTKNSPQNETDYFTDVYTLFELTRIDRSLVY